jgi:transaldolase/glucose-6-phosphate isomerase
VKQALVIETKHPANPLLELETFGQSIWLDFIRKGMLDSGEFQSLIEKDGILGVTSNPSIFEKSIVGSHDYDEAIRAAALEGKTSPEIYQRLTIADVRKAADLLKTVFETSKEGDGFVSLEVSPHLANDTEGTVREAHKLWKEVSRPNILIKVPATLEGIGAIRQLISEGINVNVTLLFGLDRYAEVVEAYLSGLESRAKAGKSLKGITSVASFFLSRIDVLIDPMLEKVIREKTSKSALAKSLLGQTAISSAKIAYQNYKKVFGSERFKKLKKQGASSQRLLWASTSTKNSAESDIKYVEALIGPETVNTLPLETLNAYRDHGDPDSRLESKISLANERLKNLNEVGINLKSLSEELEKQGAVKFSLAFDKLMTSLELKRKKALSPSSEIQALNLAGLGDVVQKRVRILNTEHAVHRLWRKDPTLWKSDAGDEAQIKNSLGWLHIAEKMEATLDADLKPFVQEILKSGFEHVVHMGMGGSSLAALAFSRTFECQECENGLPLTVLDTTDPSTIKKLTESIPVEKTLFIVASKSGSTAEPLAFKDYFYELVKQIKGDKAGENFVAITDPGSPLVAIAEKQNFRRIFLNASDIGGRYSALSYFGLVPAALMGVNVTELLMRALQSAHASMANDSPALVLGAALGEMALKGRDKVTLIVDKSIATLGMWLEQLLAESTGKEGLGLIPVAEEPLGSPASYGEDRLFVHLTVSGSVEGLLRSGADALRQSGQPMISIEISDLSDFGQQFFRWEFATALAGSILGINPFNQPNVQESKDNTNRLLAQSSEKIISEKSSIEKSPVVGGGLIFYPQATSTSGLDALVKLLKSAKKGDYVAILAYLPETPRTFELLQTIRMNLRDGLLLATTLGFGPRYLHSTGQLYKGGPNTGIFIQLTADDSCDVSIPGKPYTFGVFKRAQAEGDLAALYQHGRRAMRIHLGADPEKGLGELDKLMNQALGSL